MLPTKIYTIVLSANEISRQLLAGNLFKILSSTGAVRVESTFGRLDDLVAGQGLESTPFEWLTLTDTSGAGNTVRLLVGDEKFIDGLSGSITIGVNNTPISPNFTNAANTVTNASAQLVAASATRKYLLIQNNDTAGSIVISFGVAATLLNGIVIPPGGAYEMNNTQTSGAVHAIGTIASNTKIVVVTG